MKEFKTENWKNNKIFFLLLKFLKVLMTKTQKYIKIRYILSISS